MTNDRWRASTLDWIDYRERLGIGFSDNEKTNMFITNVLSFLGQESARLSKIMNDREYAKFCLTTGTASSGHFTNKDIIMTLHQVEYSFIEFLAYCVAIINSKEKEKKLGELDRNDFIIVVEKLLKMAHIPFEVFRDDKDEYFIFPKGAEELDDALISEPLRWLEGYPKAHKTFCNALKQYSEGIYIRDVADNLRKALEEFLQEFLGNEKNLETNKVEICKYLGDQDVDSGISGLYQPLISSYKNINDRIAKHHDKIDEKLLEFLLYQTGILIRMTITVKNAEN